jgi:hypothetical protein
MTLQIIIYSVTVYVPPVPVLCYLTIFHYIQRCEILDKLRRGLTA